MNFLLKKKMKKCAHRACVPGYTFWSLFEALAPMIFFFPLFELEISGYEAFAVAFFRYECFPTYAFIRVINEFVKLRYVHLFAVRFFARYPSWVVF